MNKVLFKYIYIKITFIMIIYEATNEINGKKYVGKTTKSLEERIKTHKYRYKKTDTVFYRAIRKYGFDNFKWKIILQCNDLKELNKKEKLLISENLGGYNVAKGGDGGDTISNHPNLEIIKENVSKFHKGKTLSEEHKEKISNAHKGMEKPWAKKTAKMMSKLNKGKESSLRGTTLSEEHKQKISKGNKGKKKVFTEEHKRNIGKANEGKKSSLKGKTYEEIHGVEKALEMKLKQSKKRKNRVVSEETKKKISESMKKRKNEK